MTETRLVCGRDGAEGVEELPLEAEGQAQRAADQAGATGPAALLAFKARLRAEVDTEAEAERLKWITPGSGQALVYERKRAEAAAVLAAVAADPSFAPAPGAYPLLEVSVGKRDRGTGAMPAGVVEAAQIVHDLAAAWVQVAAAVEEVRLSAKLAIDDALDAAAAQKARDDVAWPTPPA